MRFYKVFGAKTGPMGLKAKNHYFSNRISINFVFHRHTELLLGTQNCSPGAQHGVLEAGLDVLEAALSGLACF